MYFKAYISSVQSCQVWKEKGFRHLLDVDLDVLLQSVAVQVEDQVVDKVESVADDDERQLVGQLGFLRAKRRENVRFYPTCTVFMKENTQCSMFMNTSKEYQQKSGVWVCFQMWVTTFFNK